MAEFDLTQPAWIIAAVIVVALGIYAISGGADFGGGVWDLFARGPRAERQRAVIERAIAPIWEANHVWLILVVVLLFVCFPGAFAALTTALHVPLTVMLVGVVLRGSAFTFRSYDRGPGATERGRRWSRVFAVSSVVTPVFLGVCLGAAVSGALHIGPDGRVVTDFVSAWWAPFPFALGLFVLALFAQLAAVYLAADVARSEGADAPLAADFRLRALGATVAVVVTAWLAFALTATGAPALRQGLTGGAWALAGHAFTAIAGVTTTAALWRRKFALARWAVIAQTFGVVGGWAASQVPYVVLPDLTIRGAAAPASVLWPVVGALGLGSVLLIPAFWLLYRVFRP
ncbi:MAG: cytochrome d ubiquinol oxidase subunit II [Deltaproteobacteria bacterium]|nr:cytochrome d ubiquinol oxidase subunit II [Deltaproteobacteria bacterium]